MAGRVAGGHVTTTEVVPTENTLTFAGTFGTCCAPTAGRIPNAPKLTMASNSAANWKR